MSSKDQIQRVVELCNNDPRCANDDSILLDQYWHAYDNWVDSRSLYWNLSRSTAPGSITRARRKAHELGLITYTAETDKAREERYKEELGDNSDYAVSWMYD